MLTDRDKRILRFIEKYKAISTQQADAMRAAKNVIKEVAEDFEKWTGRKYGFFEEYRLEDAELAIVCMNSTAGTTKAVVDSLVPNT